MKKLILFCLLFTSFNAQSVVVLEYDIKNTFGTRSLPLPPKVNTVNGSWLNFSGNAGFGDQGQIGSYDWQVINSIDELSPNSSYYSFTLTPVGVSYDFSKANITFGASVQFDGYIAVFANDRLINNTYLGSNGAFKDHTLTLSGLDTSTQPIEFKLVGWGLTDTGYLGLDTGIIPGTLGNLKVNNVHSITNPIPEPKEYAIIACVGLGLFVLYKRTKGTKIIPHPNKQ